MFGPWAPELLIFDLKMKFFAQNCIFSPLDMSGIRKVDQTMMTFVFQYDFCQIRSLD